MTRLATNNASGATGPCGGNVGRASTRKGMTGRTGSNHPGRESIDHVRQWQRRLWSAAKRQPGRRFHHGKLLTGARDRRGHSARRETIAQLNPVLRGWGGYFRTGNAAVKFGQVDAYVAWRLKRVLVQRHGRTLRPGQAAQWTPDFFHALGLHRLRGTIRYPEAA